jgi:hypothetical protein
MKCVLLGISLIIIAFAIAYNASFIDDTIITSFGWTFTRAKMGICMVATFIAIIGFGFILCSRIGTQTSDKDTESK